ncbi:hypothetical protein [Rubripirellula lacrimiformis]|uniref:hypothetical protein n=1 Tax=Rubripirellula lacrimiformis TaxID=1930273 RepID=UPI0011A34544|nr:hypothetical protein [Rubripirellula lacrimiformis]
MLLVFGLFTAAIRFAVAIQNDGVTIYRVDLPTQIILSDLIIVGVVYGTCSGLIWMISCLPRAWARYLARFAVVVSMAAILNFWGTHDWLKNLSNMGGLALSQCTIFLILQVPGWRWGSAMPADPGPGDLYGRRQFQISDVVVATTCTAFLYAAVVRYVAPVAAAQYWLVTMAIWGIGPVIAACLHFSILVSSRSKRIGLAIGGVVLAFAGTLGLAIAQASASSLQFPSLRLPIGEGPGTAVAARTAVHVGDATPFYGALMIGFVVTLVMFSAAGRLEAIFVRSTGQES